MKTGNTTLINIHTCPDFDPKGNPDDVYIGRFNRRRGRPIYPRSKWANPFKDGTREEVIEKYREHLRTSGLINQIEELRGKRLGCWCAPAPCHGEVLIELLNMSEVQSRATYRRCVKPTARGADRSSLVPAHAGVSPVEDARCADSRVINSLHKRR